MRKFLVQASVTSLKPRQLVPNLGSITLKIKGKTVSGANVEYIVIPRGNDDDIVFKARAVLDFTPFDKLCPIPMPPKRKIRGEDIPMLTDPNYQTQCTAYGQKKLAWILLESLKATEGLEWDTVDMDDQSTWLRFRDELNASGFTGAEVDRILDGVVTVNALNAAKLDAARERFLLMQQELSEELSSLREEESSTQSGGPAKDSV